MADPTIQPATITSGARQVTADPPAPAGENGWTPANVRYVRSRSPLGFGPSAVQFVVKPIPEHPGQRLSQEMVDELAPFYASQFQVDEAFARNVLNQVYIYIGGPISGEHTATTSGTHVFVPTEEDIDWILSPGGDGKRWLTHELAHAMQFAVYDGNALYNSASGYGRGVLLAHNPDRAGSGTGPAVWGSLFTGLRLLDKPDGEFLPGEASNSLAQKLQFSLLPAAALGVPLGLVAGAAVDAARHFGRGALPAEVGAILPKTSHLNGMLTGFAAISAPALVGGLAGASVGMLGQQGSEVAGTIGGAAIAGLGVLALQRHGGAAQLAGWKALVPLAVGMGVGAVTGLLSSRISANTIRGWSTSSELIRERGVRQGPPADFSGALHDAHWREIDAEAVAQAYVDPNATTIDPDRFQGKLPAATDRLTQRLEWGVLNPVLIGAPVALAAGAGVAVARIGMTALGSTLRGDNLPTRVRLASQLLGGQRKGIANSMGVGAAVTIVPLLAGSVAGGVADALGAPKELTNVAGAVGAMAATGAHLAWLLGGHGQSLAQMAPKILAGMAIAAPIGWLMGTFARSAAQPFERYYELEATI